MEMPLHTLSDLKTFLNTLTEEQLKRPIVIAPEDHFGLVVVGCESLECDYISPSDELFEPITEYHRGRMLYGKLTAEELAKEPIVAHRGDTIFFAEERT